MNCHAIPVFGGPDLDGKDQIDRDFISRSEGGTFIQGYIPQVDNTSGVTIGTGVDLGSLSQSDLRAWGASDQLRKQLDPYLGKKGADARAFLTDPASLKSVPLQISQTDADLLTTGAHRRALGELANKYRSATGKDFYALTPAQQTVMADIVYQTGLGGIQNRFAGGQFWKQATGGDWVGAAKTLMNMPSNYKTRRRREGVLLGADLWE